MRVQDRTPERLGPYRLIKRIGEGGMGVVYLGVDSSDAEVAIKALHPGLAQETNARRRMSREVETMQRVRSPYVAEVLDADLDGDPPYIVTRYVPGLTLEEVVAAGGALTGAALARLAYGLAEALAAVHDAGVVHRDLKPGNVMISDGQPVVIDFGIAHLPETTRLTLTGMFMGTPGYLAPEVIEGKDSGTASDVHSWGATVAFAATGRPPYGTGPFETIFYRIMHGSPNLDTMPAPLQPIVLDALARQVGMRPSAAEIGRRIVALDPDCLIPSPPAVAPTLVGGTPIAYGPVAGEQAAGPFAGGPAVGSAAGVDLGGINGGPAAPLEGIRHTVADQQESQAWPSTTMPLGNSRPGDVRDLLPPVKYGTSDGAGRPADTANWGGPGPPGWSGGASLAGASPEFRGTRADSAGDAGPAGTQAPRQEARRTLNPVSSWSPLVIATVAIVVAVSVAAPIIGTGLALALLVALRAATITGRHLARRSGDGRRGSRSLIAIAFYPLAMFRAVVGLVLVAPVALLAFCVAAAITIIAVPVHPLPQGAAFGAGALVAVVGLGPGSSGSRKAMAGLYTAAARGASLRTVAYVGIVAVAIWAGLTAWYQSPAPDFWPASNLHYQLVHLPTLRTLLTDVRQNVLSFAHQIGL
jgi:serine/threonine kinase PknH